MIRENAIFLIAFGISDRELINKVCQSVRSGEGGGAQNSQHVAHVASDEVWMLSMAQSP